MTNVKEDVFIPHTNYFFNEADILDMSEFTQSRLIVAIMKVKFYGGIETLSKAIGYGDISNLTSAITMEHRSGSSINVSLFLGQKKYEFAELVAGQDDVWKSLVELCDKERNISFLSCPDRGLLVFFDEDVIKSFRFPSRRDAWLRGKFKTDALQRFYAKQNSMNIVPGIKIPQKGSYVSVPNDRQLEKMFDNNEQARRLDSYVTQNADIILHSDYDACRDLWNKEYTDTQSPVVETVTQMLFRVDPFVSDGYFETLWKAEEQTFYIHITSPRSYNLSELRFYRPNQNENNTLEFAGTNESAQTQYQMFFGVINHQLDKYFTNGNWSFLYWPNDMIALRADGKISFNFNDYIYLFRDRKPLDLGNSRGTEDGSVPSDDELPF